ncbi:MAG: patatin family protein [Clostridia bacterium]|nr:patatin family protein [Clostridia bacterium]
MTKKAYSGSDGIPSGSAGENVTEGCLVLEGGAFRGLYTQGVLDVLMMRGLNFRSVIGVSAGALAGANYLSGQIGRSARINLGYRHDSRYIGQKALRNSGSILDVGFLTEDRGILEPFDRERFDRPARNFTAVATCLENGETVFFEKGSCTDIMLSIRASATMPFISPPVAIDGLHYLDGGCSLAIPFRRAIDSGSEKIVVIRTRCRGFRTGGRRNRAALRFYRDHPAFAEKLAGSMTEYDRECDELDRLESAGGVFVIYPSERVDVSRMEGDLEKLGRLYRLGISDCEALLPDLADYLEKNARLRG